MSKISKKLLTPIIIMIAVTTICTIFINLFVIERFLLRQQRQLLWEIYQTAITLDPDPESLTQLEESYGVTIVTFPFTADEDQFNDHLWTGLQQKRIGFQKLWLWTDGLEKLQSTGSYSQIYDQGHLKYSILVRYGIHQGTVYAITMNIPYSAHILTAVNYTTVISLTFSGIVIIVLTLLTVTKILRPVKQLTEMAEEISRQNFKTIEIHTGDEIESLAASFNHMSEQLDLTQKFLTRQNQQMETLLSDVAHEVKTPAAVIKAYAFGIQDGIDDGTFITEIIKQSDYINEMVQSLLTISRIKLAEMKPALFSLSQLISEIVSAHELIANQNDLCLITEIEPDLTISSDQNSIYILINNLVSNAVKYAKSTVKISLTVQSAGCLFTISNDLHTGSDPDPEKIFDPFYVEDSARSKLKSGTGLGLSIVKEITERLECPIECYKKNHEICFEVIFSKL